MIIGFGNNVVSALAGDITTGQTEIPVMPGTGAKFAKLLSADFENKSNTQRVYAKITLTDNKESAFEICHLVSVSGDVLNVVRGQEGTTPKGWYLNDVVANFATRGSENHFVQIAQLQSGHYIAGVAGGTANALTLELPATFFVNGSTDWTLRTPIIVFPVQNNTNAVTLQLILGGKVLGTFPLYKGNKSELTANDIIKGIPLICVLDSEKMYFSVINPGNIYSDFDQRYVKKSGDTMTGALNLPDLNASGVVKSAGEMQTTSANSYRIIYGEYGVFWHQNGNDLYLMLTNSGDPYGGFNNLRPFVVNLATGKVTMANGATIHGLRAEGSIALNTDNALGVNSIVLGDSDTGFKQQGDGILDVFANGAHVFRFINGNNESVRSLVVHGNCHATGEVLSGNGAAKIATDGNIYGPVWGGWLSNYIQNRTGVQDIRLGAVVWVGPSANGSYASLTAPDGHVLTAILDGDTVRWPMPDSPDAAYARPIQKLINGTWYNVGSV
ncbi:phage tail fiber protein [Citrobacter sp. S-77]|uniref:phage tail fiber protein n=1 Tax=Citrobacter sp. S-77 TaxID=1080067 RepID=UPI0005EF395B|nr:hypothetical protein [Citrobacter sp. S-77]